MHGTIEAVKEYINLQIHKMKIRNRTWRSQFPAGILGALIIVTLRVLVESELYRSLYHFDGQPVFQPSEIDNDPFSRSDFACYFCAEDPGQRNRQIDFNEPFSSFTLNSSRHR